MRVETKANNPNHFESIYEEAIVKFGKRDQVLVALEECSELAAAISRYMTGKGRPEDILEEIADVEIMCEQLRLMFDMDEDVDDIKNQKLTRLRNGLSAVKLPSEEAA